MHFFTRPNRYYYVFLLLLGAFALNAQVLLNTKVEPVAIGGSTAISVTVDNFTDVAAMQFTVNWDPAILEFEAISSEDGGINFTEANYSTGLIAQGELPVAWISTNVEAFTLEDGSSLFTLHFKLKSNVPSEIYFDGTPTPIEFVSSSGGLLWVSSTTNTVEIASRLVKGKVFIDENADCSYQDGEVGLQEWILEVNDGIRSYFLHTSVDGLFGGYFSPGTYTIKLIGPENDYWSVCNSSQTITVEEGTGADIDLSFAAQVNTECAALSVDVSTAFLRRCFDNYYRIAYCNQGTKIAEETYILLELPPEISITDSPVAYTEQEAGIFRFDIGNVPINTCDGFVVKVLLDCESTEISQTHCVKASIFPDEVCSTDNLWSGASLSISPTCEDDSIRFDIKNIGDGDMTAPQEYIVIQDMIMFRTVASPIQLNSGSSKAIRLPANGATYRLEMEQVLNHPTEQLIASAIEGCGVNDQGQVSRGFINRFARADESPFVDEDCQENIGSFDPNDKTGYPLGYGPKHYIDQNKKLTYHIRFQNTGTDTAFNVVILDTLSAHLNVATFKPLSASHAYEVAIQKENILKFSFNDILLVDSVKNEPLSHGYIRFEIDQQIDVPLETVINNSAAIYFDFNEPVLTNVTEHTVGKDFIEVEVKTALFDIPNLQLSIAPNPFAYTTKVTIDKENMPSSSFLLYDMNGRMVQQYTFDGNQFDLHRTGLESGMYLYKVVTEGQLMGRGKLLVR